MTAPNFTLSLKISRKLYHKIQNYTKRQHNGYFNDLSPSGLLNKYLDLLVPLLFVGKIHYKPFITIRRAFAAIILVVPF